MNTPRSPREILLARHAASRPALVAQRAALLSRFDASTSTPVEASTSMASARPPAVSLREILALLHRELFSPCRHVWSALACIWIGILVSQQLNYFAAPHAPSVAKAPAAQSDTALLALWLEQRRLLAELGARPAPAPASADTPTTLPAPQKASPASSPRPLGSLAPASGLTPAATTFCA